ncbi:MAG: NUDIX domain-containing protein [Deltaproteobacteria bacterium]|nr:NUDIX domain-containing protein [Deltaproteobacteria bacterium]
MSAPEPATPRPAATVVVLRPGEGGLAEVLLVRRHHGQGFMANVWVFPGGRVDEADQASPDAHVAAAVRETAEEAGIALAGPLVWCSHWITPVNEKKRFDTRFFVTTVPGAAEARPDATEVTEAVWLSAADALARHDAGAFPLAPPTWVTLRALAGLSCEAALAWASAQRPEPVTPTLGLVDGALEVRSALGTLALVQGRWVSRDGAA